MANRISVNEGRRETMRRGGPTAGRPDGLQLARTKTTNKSLRSTIPPAREPTGGANEDVSWLRAKTRRPSRHQRQWLIHVWARQWLAPTARYSGGAAPDSHRLPYPRSRRN